MSCLVRWRKPSPADTEGNIIVLVGWGVPEVTKSLMSADKQILHRLHLDQTYLPGSFIPLNASHPHPKQKADKLLETANQLAGAAGTTVVVELSEPMPKYNGLESPTPVSSPLVRTGVQPAVRSTFVLVAPHPSTLFDSQCIHHTLSNLMRFRHLFRATSGPTAKTLHSMTAAQLEKLRANISSQSIPAHIQDLVMASLRPLFGILEQQNVVYLEPHPNFNFGMDPAKSSKMASVVARLSKLVGSPHNESLNWIYSNFDIPSHESDLNWQSMALNLYKIAASSTGVSPLSGGSCFSYDQMYFFAENHDLKAPFARIIDRSGHQVPDIFCLKHPPRYPEERAHLKRLKNDNWMIGVSSYQDWPGEIINPHDFPEYRSHDMFKREKDYHKLIGWCHCFRHPERHIPQDIPSILLPESDFMDPNTYKCASHNQEKEYDVIYNCQDGNWQEYCRNWKLGKRCVERMAKDYNLRILLIGKKGGADEPKHPNISSTSFLDWNEFKRYLCLSRFLFVPNIHDASPRVAAEAMLSNIPVLENSRIVGGWHYMSPETGMTFSGWRDFDDKLVTFLHRLNAGLFHPRKWFTSRYGKERAGLELYRFVSQLPRKNYTLDKGRTRKYGPVSPDNDEVDEI